MINCARFLLVAALALSTGVVGGFDATAYKTANLDEIIKQSRSFNPGETSGQTLLQPPSKLHFSALLERHPEACSDELPRLTLTAVGVTEMVPMGHRMKLRSGSGQIVNVWIQESIAGFVREEYALGDPIEVRALWIFVKGSDKKPCFVVNGIGPL